MRRHVAQPRFPRQRDFRRKQVETAPRPEPDANGLITYETYQVVVARRGDTVAQVASRVGLTAAELASFNGRGATDVLREGEVLAMPRRVGPAAAPTSPPSRAAPSTRPMPPPAAAGPQVQQGVEPVRHRVGRGETAYSIARLYGVSVRSLAEWNGLGPDLAVRENQFLIIPIVLEGDGHRAPRPPGDSIAPPPPSAGEPLPDPIETAPLPPATGGGPTPPAPAPEPEPEPEPEPAVALPAARSRAPILRAFSSANEGIDISAATGTAVRAAGDGEVAAITQDTDQVPILVIRHDDGLLTVYANIRNISVTRGQSISRGQQVAEVGRAIRPSCISRCAAASRRWTRTATCREGARSGGHRAPPDRLPSAVRI
jgi:lipoprotein NlpD